MNWNSCSFNTIPAHGKFAVPVALLCVFIWGGSGTFASAQTEGSLGASSDGVSADGVVVPDYLGPASRDTLERIAPITENFQAVRALLVIGVTTGSASPEGAAAALAPGPDTADALASLTVIERQQIMQQIELLEVLHGNDFNEQERAFWNAIVDSVNGDGVGSVSGEPHLVTLDGLRFGFQAAGEFVALRSVKNNLEVQLRLVPWGGLETVTVVAAAAFRVGVDRVTITYADPILLRVNGRKVDLRNRAISLEGGGVLAEKNDVVSVIWPDLSTARISTSPMAHLDVSLRLATGHKGKVGGLLGNFDDVTENDVQLPDGNVLELPELSDPDYREVIYEIFRNAWAVTPEDSIFDYAEGESISTFDRPEIPSAIASLETLDPERRHRAEKVCDGPRFTVEELYRQCVFDVGITGEAGFGFSALNSEMRVRDGNRREWEGAVIRGAIDQPGASDSHYIEISRHQGLFVMQEAFDPLLDLVQIGVYDENGNRLALGCFGCGNLGLIRVKGPGRYRFTAGSPRDRHVGSYRARYWLVPNPDRFEVDAGGFIGPGQPGVGAGQIEVPGSTDEYEFRVDAPTTFQVSIEYYDPKLSLVRWQIIADDGKLLKGTCLSCGDLQTVQFAEAGAYRLSVGTNDRDEGTGLYAITLSEIGKP